MPIPVRTCHACSYPVASASSRCPECGTVLADRAASESLASRVLRVRLLSGLAFVLAMAAILYLRGVLLDLIAQLPPAPLAAPPSLVRQIYTVEATLAVACVAAGVAVLGAISIPWFWRVRQARSAPRTSH